MLLGISDFIITTLLHNPEENADYTALMYAALCVVPSFAFRSGLSVYSRNYWLKRSCGTAEQKQKCALHAVHPCCPGTTSDCRCM